MPRSRKQTTRITLPLPGGQRVTVHLPAKWIGTDRDGSPTVKPPALRFLDMVQAVAMDVPAHPMPGYVITLRKALDMTQKQFARVMGVDPLTVSRWERGELRPGQAARRRFENARQQAAEMNGVEIDERRGRKSAA